MLWVKSLHVISIIAWMAALLYLPRLMVYHADCAVGSERSETFKTMERRLLRGIAIPAMSAAWIFGLWMAWIIQPWGEGWFWVKIICVVALSAYQGQASRWTRDFANDGNSRSSRFFRIANEVPAVLMVVIVIMVIVKPF